MKAAFLIPADLKVFLSVPDWLTADSSEFFPYWVGNVNATEDNILTIGEREFVQVRPFVFRHRTDTGIDAKDNRTLFVYVTEHNGSVTRISTADFFEFIPVSETDAWMVWPTLILFIAGVLFAVISGIVVFILRIIRRAKKKDNGPAPFAKKLSIGLNLFVLLPIVNSLVMAGISPAASYESLTLHFIINIAYMVLSAACAIVVFVGSVKDKLTKGNRIYCICSCAATVIIIAFMIMWEFYR